MKFSLLILSVVAALPLCAAMAGAQAAGVADAGLTVAGTGQTDAAGQPVAAVSKITLAEAIRRAQANEPNYALALADNRFAQQDRWITRSTLLPNAVYHNQALYTQPGSQFGTTSPRFIANNAVHEYTSQAVVNETVGLAQVAGVMHADATAARAAAELEVARRGLVAAVTTLYYGTLAGENKLAVAREALQEAADFRELTEKREAAREAAHADVVKAQLMEMQRGRELSDAELNAERAHLELGVLLFPDPRTAYAVAAADSIEELPLRAAVEEAASKNNPELRSALAAMRMSDADVLGARAAYLPDVNVNLNYGIDAPQFSVNGPDHISNLGYSAAVTVDVPVWDWLATHGRVKQSEIRRDATRVALTAAQRRVMAQLDETFSEATASRNQLASLDRSVTIARESLRLTRLRYSEGEGTVLEVVDAETAFVDAQNMREDGRVRFEAARAQLETLAGTL